MDTKNFETFSREEYQNLLDEFDIKNFSDLIGRNVYYSRREYGEHRILKWDQNKGEYLLEIDSQKFWSNPFRIKLA
jgi:hypothetical protein